MAKRFSTELDNAGQPNSERHVGRPESLRDMELRASRENLLSLLEGTWAEVGWSLQRIKNRPDVRPALRKWETIARSASFSCC